MGEVEEKKRFMVRQWEDLKKSGGVTFGLNQMEQILQGGDGAVLTREEVMSKVIGYFNSCVKVVLDEDTQERVTTWVRNPTKSGLALCLGIDKQTLLDYVKGVNLDGKTYSKTKMLELFTGLTMPIIRNGAMSRSLSFRQNQRQRRHLQEHQKK